MVKSAKKTGTQDVDAIMKMNGTNLPSERPKFDIDGFRATKRRPAGTSNMSSTELELYNKFVMPALDETYEDYLVGEDSTIDVDFLKRGEKDMRRFAEGLAGKLTQETYTLLMNNNLTMETVMKAMNIWPPNAAETKYSNLIKRFYKDKEGNIRDAKVDNNIVLEPDKLFNLILTAHLKNGHLKTAVLFQCLREVYANCTRDFVQTALFYCNRCNPDRYIKPIEKVRHRNINEELLPLERVHIEVFAPFEKEEGDIKQEDSQNPYIKIEGKYSHVFYCRDFRTRYVWCFPLKNMKFKTLVDNIATFFMTVLYDPPIFVESSTIDRDDLKEIIELLASKYGLKLGLGFANFTKFHAQGIKRFKTHLHRAKSECADDWLMCLKQGTYSANRVIERQLGKASNILFTELMGQFERDMRKKKLKYIEQSFSENIKTYPKSGGCIFIEHVQDYEKTMESIDRTGTYKSGRKADQLPAEDTPTSHGPVANTTAVNNRSTKANKLNGPNLRKRTKEITEIPMSDSDDDEPKSKRKTRSRTRTRR